MRCRSRAARRPRSCLPGTAGPGCRVGGSPGGPRPARRPGGPHPPRPAPPPVKRGPADPRKDLADRIAKEREWRQSTNKGVQFLALQYEASRCFQEDILAGNDDPDLPLVTCDTQHKQAYLLAPSIIR